jgi:hypothetical protein
MYAGIGLAADGECAGDEAMSLREEYEWSMVYIRALALVNDSLHAEKNLEAMTRLHEKLVDSTGITYVATDSLLRNRNIFLEPHIEALLREIGIGRLHWDKAVMTGAVGLLPWVKVRNGWFEKRTE